MKSVSRYSIEFEHLKVKSFKELFEPIDLLQLLHGVKERLQLHYLDSIEGRSDFAKRISKEKPALDQEPV